MKIILVRHGQTDWNVRGMWQGSHDIELNETGIMQAEELSRNLLNSEYKFTKIFSSPLKRARKTAEILAKVSDVECEVVEGLEEVNFGDWEGLSLSQIKETYPIDYNEWHGNRRYANPHHGESYDAMLQRVLAAVRKIVNENPEGNRDIIIVTHVAVIMSIQCYITDTPFEEMMKFKAENTSITELDGNLLF